MPVKASIPDPLENLGSLRVTALATKELVETIAGQRGLPGMAAVTWQDLLDLGLITPDRMPKASGPHRR